MTKVSDEMNELMDIRRQCRLNQWSMMVQEREESGLSIRAYKVQAAALDYALDHCVKIELGQHVLHVGRKACEIVAEVGFDILGVGKQLVKGELACVVELIARGLRQKAVDDREVLYLFVCILNRLPCG